MVLIKNIRKMEREILFNGKWGACFDPITKTMYGGYCEDGKTFKPDFVITDLEEYNMPCVLSMCVSLYSGKGKINASFGDVLEDFYNAQDKWYYESVFNKDGACKEVVK